MDCKSVAGLIHLSDEKSFPITGLDRPLGLQEVEAPRISKQSAHECGRVFDPREDPWYSFMLNAELTPGP